MKMIKIMLLTLCTGIFFSCKKNNTNEDTGTDIKVNVNLSHTVGNTAFNSTTTFTNPFGEQYKLERFHYYVSNIQLISSADNSIESEQESYHLIKAELPESGKLTFNIKKKTADKIRFLIGVDSIRNVSGAQTGALDPLNGMFWTWHSGYIMAKLEGTSPQSNAVSNLVTYHIGGFSGVNKTLRWVTLNLPSNAAGVNGYTINLKCDINKFFNGVYPMKITDEPIMMDHGPKAAKFADNYATMFSIQ